MSWLRGFQATIQLPLPIPSQIQAVRFRYHEDKVKRGPLIRRHGYTEQILTEGLLPRVDIERKLPKPDYKFVLLYFVHLRKPIDSRMRFKY